MFQANYSLFDSALHFFRPCHVCRWVSVSYSTAGIKNLPNHANLRMHPSRFLLWRSVTPEKTQQNAARCWNRSKSDSSYVTQSGVTLHFDTHKLVRKLGENGFSETQAEGLMSSLVEIISSSVHSVANSTVSKIDQERLEVKFNAMVDSVRNEMFLLEQGKFTRIQEENQKLRDEVTSLKGILQDEVAKLKGGMALDFSLEKSRVKEELATRDQKIKDTENRIETEVAKLGTQLEAQKLDLIKYLAGSLLSCLTLFLAVWRFVKN
ncbi:mitochondrial calcium uniporter regulator 1-like [Acropora palmata]|uniref:mitochondrial calcium uniporter regulator 1-like n=1 Tax=Acropora palmata TaxID=6131 RepID=UPI003D9FD4F9